MHLAGHTYSFRERPLAAALDAIQALGLDAVEVWLGHVRPGAAAARAVRHRGMRVVAVGAGGFYEEDAGAMKRAFATAEELESPVLVACVLPRLLPELVCLTPPGVRLCVENHWDQPLAKPAEVLEAIGSRKGVGACLDTGHSLLAGSDPAQFARALGPRLGHVHLKEARRPSTATRFLGRKLRRRLLARPAPVAPGDGHLDTPALVATLKSMGYPGAISVEHEGGSAAEAVARLLAAARSAVDAQGISA